MLENQNVDWAVAVGWRLQTLQQGGPAALRDASRHAWLAAASRGVRPRDWHPAWLEACAVDTERNIEDVHTLAGAYFAAADRGEYTLARTYFDHAWSNLNWVADHQRHAFWLERAYLLARCGDVIEARTVLNRVAITGVDFVSRQRTSAAVLLAEGHCEEAIRAAQSGREALHQSGNGGLVLAEMDWLDAITLEAQEQLRIVSDLKVTSDVQMPFTARVCERSTSSDCTSVSSRVVRPSVGGASNSHHPRNDARAPPHTQHDLEH
jgi:hypothetical protein